MMCPFATTETNRDSSSLRRNRHIRLVSSSQRSQRTTPASRHNDLHLGIPHTSLTVNGSTPGTQSQLQAQLGVVGEGHAYTAQLQTKEHNVYNCIRVEMNVETSSLKLEKVSDVPTCMSVYCVRECSWHHDTFPV